ncbi:MAG: branched-chain amino acid ABC transporter permease [Proteobacteria bacterium]|nr:branched-chain amino acid ABC transporter permease [Pseudomonadota bacterium]
MKNNKLIYLAIGFVVLVLLAVFPFILPKLQLNIVIEIAFFSLFVLSYTLLLGYGGLLSFGHAAFFGIGGYLTAIIIRSFPGVHLLLVILISAAAAALAAFWVGFFCVRRSGTYFALLTLAFNQFFFAVALKWSSVTGGDDGLGIKLGDMYLPFVGNIHMHSTTNMYYLVMAVVVLCMVGCWFLLKTPFGNTVAAVKDNEDRAWFIGYNVLRTKLTLFTISGLIAGIAGSLFVLFEEFVSLGCINLVMSTQVLFMAFIGGTGSFFGPILGSAVYIYFTEWISGITENWEFFLGVLFILLIMYAHRGLIGIIGFVVDRFRTSE